MQERVDSVQAAGFTDLGLSIRWMTLWLADHDLGELDSMLESGGLRVGELEALRIMGSEPDPREETAALLAERYRPARLQCTGPYEGSVNDAAVRAARVADRFAEWGVDVVLEPLPFTNMATPADAAEIITLADRPNLSMCLDVWHLYRAGLGLDALAGLWPYITTVQLNDGTLIAQDPDLYADCLHNRKITGAGEFDVVGLLRMARQHRPDSTYSVEVISTELRSQDAALTSMQIAEGLATVFAQADV